MHENILFTSERRTIPTGQKPELRGYGISWLIVKSVKDALWAFSPSARWLSYSRRRPHPQFPIYQVFQHLSLQFGECNSPFMEQSDGSNNLSKAGCYSLLRLLWKLAFKMLNQSEGLHICPKIYRLLNLKKSLWVSLISPWQDVPNNSSDSSNKELQLHSYITAA